MPDRNGKRFGGQVALVTGAASGIGRAAAERLAVEGAALVLADRAGEVEAVADAIRAAGGRAEAHVGDAGDEAFVAGLVDAAAGSFGGMHLCFANAGIGGGLARLHEATVAEWQEVLRVNLVGVFLAIRESARIMVPAGGGSIVATASVAGIRSGAGGLAYSAAKAGVINLVQTSANQLAGTGVRVNAICPGLTETGMTRPMFDMARARGSEAKLGQLNPLRRYARPEEAAAAALFLLSEEASYVNGQALAVDGGLSSSHPTVPGKFV
jgi:NAD(P)-dependent dehydrogenase (short-subunit alcohol dehydrogenase family)